MALDTRLVHVLQMVRPNVQVPIIIKTVPGSEQAVRSHVHRLGAATRGASRILPAMVYATATGSVIKQIASLPGVQTVYYDEPVYSANALPLTYSTAETVQIPLLQAVTHVGCADLWDAGVTGRGTRVGIIDTGVSTSHPMLRNRVSGIYSAVPDEGIEDVNGHGSWCTSAVGGAKTDSDVGVLQGAAPDADLYALKALSDTGTGQMSWVMDCIDHAVLDFECRILSLSLGSMTDNAGADPVSQLVNEVTTTYNCLCVIAAGNQGGAVTIGSPGGAVGALTVGATSIRIPSPDKHSSFSSMGPTTAGIIKPDICAPGGNVVPGGPAELLVGAGPGTAYRAFAGTSMATPIVAGAMALIRSVNPDVTRAGIELALIQASKAFGIPVKTPVVGYGVLDAAATYTYCGTTSAYAEGMLHALGSLQTFLSYPMSLVPRQYSEQMMAVKLPLNRQGVDYAAAE